MIKTADGKEILEDGEHLYVGMLVMDAQQRAVATRAILANDTVGHKPGSLPLTDAQRAHRTELYRDYDKKLSEQWKNPVATVSNTAAPQLTGDARKDAYAHYQQRIANAWRHQ